MRTNPPPEDWVTFEDAARVGQQWDVHRGACGHSAIWRPAEWTAENAPVPLKMTIPDAEKRLRCTCSRQSNRRPPAYAAIRQRNLLAPAGPASSGNGVSMN